MAGSYSHCVDYDGNLLDIDDLLGRPHGHTLRTGGMLSGGDIYEAIAEMYGMIWWLADACADASLSPASLVVQAQQHYRDGLEISRQEREVGTPMTFLLNVAADWLDRVGDTVSRPWFWASRLCYRAWERRGRR